MPSLICDLSASAKIVHLWPNQKSHLQHEPDLLQDSFLDLSQTWQLPMLLSKWIRSAFLNVETATIKPKETYKVLAFFLMVGSVK